MFFLGFRIVVTHTCTRVYILANIRTQMETGTILELVDTNRDIDRDTDTDKDTCIDIKADPDIDTDTDIDIDIDVDTDADKRHRHRRTPPLYKTHPWSLPSSPAKRGST